MLRSHSHQYFPSSGSLNFLLQSFSQLSLTNFFQLHVTETHKLCFCFHYVAFRLCSYSTCTKAPNKHPRRINKKQEKQTMSFLGVNLRQVMELCLHSCPDQCFREVWTHPFKSSFYRPNTAAPWHPHLLSIVPTLPLCWFPFATSIIVIYNISLSAKDLALSVNLKMCSFFLSYFLSYFLSFFLSTG